MCYLHRNSWSPELLWPSQQSRSGCFSGSLRVQGWGARQMTQKHPKLGCRIIASCSSAGQVGAVIVSRMTRHVTNKQLGLVMTHARRPCLFYSLRWWKKDGTESGWRGKQKRAEASWHAQDHTGTMRIFFRNQTVHRQTDDGWWVLICVKHVVITHAGHESAPCGAAPLTDH